MDFFTPPGLDHVSFHRQYGFLVGNELLTVNLPRLNGIADSLGALPVHLTSNAVSRAENLLHRALQLLRE